MENESKTENESQAARLLEKHGDRVFRTAFMYLKNYQDAEDVLQMTFEKYLIAKPLFKNDEHEKAWFLRVAINISKNLVTSGWKRKVIYDDEQLRLFADEAVAQDNTGDSDDNSEAVLKAVLALPKNLSVVIQLFYYEEYSVAQIADLLELGGFKEDIEPHNILVGFGHEAVLSNAQSIVDAVKSGHIRHFFLIGGCDGARPGRNYYTEFAKLVPNDCIIMTLACGKYRFNKLDFGEAAGIPRLLDIGQCNDAYSAVRIATALADAFETDINGLPLSLIISWYEQKAVADLLALLSLGFKNIYLGPTLPAFISPNVLQYLTDTFNLRLISDVGCRDAQKAGSAKDAAHLEGAAVLEGKGGGTCEGKLGRQVSEKGLKNHSASPSPVRRLPAIAQSAME